MSDEHEVEFATLLPDGTLINKRSIKQSAMRACPHVIMVPEHYLEDGTCRCTDPTSHDMIRWGYRWSEKLGRWR